MKAYLNSQVTVYFWKNNNHFRNIFQLKNTILITAIYHLIMTLTKVFLFKQPKISFTPVCKEYICTETSFLSL